MSKHYIRCLACGEKRALYEGKEGYPYRACSKECMSKLECAYNNYHPILWHPISFWRHFRADILCKPLEAVNRWLFNRGFRWKDVDWLGLWSHRIYNGKFPFKPVKRYSDA